jgi:hypothetical protein
MSRLPPEGSSIQVQDDIDSTTYIWSNGKKSWTQFPIAGFMMCWLGGWTFGGYMAVTQALFAKDMPLFGRIFIMFWLGGWLFGEIAVCYALYNIFRPLMPAILILNRLSAEYQTGTKPFDYFNSSRNHLFGQRPKLFQNRKNKTYLLGHKELSHLRLDFAGDRQRLIFDKGIERVEIGEMLSEPEREWLYEILKSHI